MCNVNIMLYSHCDVFRDIWLWVGKDGLPFISCNSLKRCFIFISWVQIYGCPILFLQYFLNLQWFSVQDIYIVGPIHSMVLKTIYILYAIASILKMLYRSTKFIKLNFCTKTLEVEVFVGGCLQEQLVIHLLKYIITHNQ